MACHHVNLGATVLPPLGHMRQYGHSKLIDNINTFHVIFLYVYFKRSFFWHGNMYTQGLFTMKYLSKYAQIFRGFHGNFFYTIFFVIQFLNKKQP